MENEENKVYLELLVSKDSEEDRERGDLQDHREMMANREALDHQDHQVHVDQMGKEDQWVNLE